MHPLITRVLHMHPIRHLRTINEHRKLVRSYCFRLGLYRQGLTHDLSKYSPAEFIRGAKYYTGKGSPIAAERRDRGISEAWLHHKGRNRHHSESWIDYIIEPDGKVGFGPLRMPPEYVAEMFCDHIAASRIYKGADYSDSSPLEHYERRRGSKIIHPETDEELRKMLVILREQGEDAAFRYVKEWLRERRR